MQEEKICIASADGHVGPPTEVYKDYLEKRLHPAFDEYYASHTWRWAAQSEDCFFPRGFNSKFWDSESFDPARGTPVAWDPQLRLKAMDQSMVACDVLNPDDQNTNDPPWGSGLANSTVEGDQGGNGYPPELVQAGARAYNRWLAEFCSAAPERLRGLTLVGTLDNVVWCCDEVERAYESGLRTGLMLPLEYSLPLYHHRRYDILWETLSDLGLPVISHVSRGHPPFLGDTPFMKHFMYGRETIFYGQRAVYSIIMGGVLERFPNLHLIPTELGTEVDWLPQMLQGLDFAYDNWSDTRAGLAAEGYTGLSMKPSEYWQRQGFLTHSIAQRREHFEGEAYDKVPNMVYGADIGHAEGWWPVFGFPEPKPESMTVFTCLPVVPVEEAIKALLNGLEAKKMLPYLQDNFFKAYPNVDRAALDSVVERIGPTASELGLV